MDDVEKLCAVHAQDKTLPKLLKAAQEGRGTAPWISALTYVELTYGENDTAIPFLCWMIYLECYMDLKTEQGLPYLRRALTVMAVLNLVDTDFYEQMAYSYQEQKNNPSPDSESTRIIVAVPDPPFSPSSSGQSGNSLIDHLKKLGHFQDDETD
jgi:hypothetical protein